MIDTKSGTDSVIYDYLGRVVKETDSRGAVKRNHVITNVYDSKGYVSQINNGSSILWKMNSSDSRGRPVSYNLGDPGLGLNVQFTYDAQGRLATKTTVQMKQTYVFDPNSGNLTSRDYRSVGSPTGLSESFGYDSFNRLTSSTFGNNTASVTYSANGNISTKSNVGGYTYDPTKVNAVSNINVSGGTIDPTQQTITYNASNLTTQIEYGTTQYNLRYNPFGERIKTVKTQTGNSTITKYYSGSYEKKITGSAVTEFHYINSPYGLVAIIESIGTAIQNTRYVETDHLGSIIGLLRSDKSYAEKLSFDAWGKRRNPLTWTYQGSTTPALTDRGFTGHEHIDWAGLINMNGRMYDPVIGRFLGVDPFVQDAGFSQSYNGYSYCLNNPLKYVDPSGYVATVTEIRPEYYEKFISQLLAGFDMGGLADLYTGQSFETIGDYLRYIEATYGEKGGNGGFLFSNENIGYNYMWLNTVKVENCGFITSKGLFVLPIMGTSYNGDTQYNNDAGHAYIEYYDYDLGDISKPWGLQNRFFLLDQRKFGKLELFGMIHTHPFDKIFYGLGFSSKYENGDDAYAEYMRGLPYILIDNDKRVHAEFFNGVNLEYINELNSLNLTDLNNRIVGSKLYPILVKYQH